MSKHKHDCEKGLCKENAIIQMAEISLGSYAKKLNKNISDLTYIEIIESMYETFGVDIKQFKR